MPGRRKKSAENPMHYYDVKLIWFPELRGLARHELWTKITQLDFCRPYTLQGIEFLLGEGALVRFIFTATHPELEDQASFAEVVRDGIGRAVREVMPTLVKD